MRLFRFLVDLPVRYGRPPTTATYNPQIDGLRAVAIVIVLIWHGGLRIVRAIDAFNSAGMNLASPYRYLPHGEVGVDLFFVISGFVIAQPFLSKSSSEWSLKQFYWRRLHRLYPPYVVMMTISLIAASSGLARESSGPNALALPSFAAAFFYLNGLIFNLPFRFNPPLWSLEVEVQFYLLVPLIMHFYANNDRQTQRMMLGLIAVVGLIMIAGFCHGFAAFDGRFRFGLLTHSYLFVCGIVFADWAFLYRPLSLPKHHLFDLILLAGFIALIVIALWLTQVDANPVGAWPNILTGLSTLVALLFIFIGAMRGPIGRWLLSRPWLCFIGSMCYSIYLVHVVVIEAVSQMLMRFVTWHTAWTVWLILPVTMMGAVCSASLVFYLFVERPFMNTLRVNARFFRTRPAWLR